MRSFDTVERWIQILELFFSFIALPPTELLVSELLKGKTLLLELDLCRNQGARWEKSVAGHLMKYCDFMKDVHGERMELRYLQDIDGREIGFRHFKNNKPMMSNVKRVEKICF